MEMSSLLKLETEAPEPCQGQVGGIALEFADVDDGGVLDLILVPGWAAVQTSSGATCTQCGSQSRTRCWYLGMNYGIRASGMQTQKNEAWRIFSWHGLWQLEMGFTAEEISKENKV